MAKIIFWISADLLSFCLAHFLQKHDVGDFYSLIDITNNPRKFFEEQEFVNFSKNWFYHDYMKINKKVDIEYIENFQKKYNIDVYELGKNDRILNNKYNPYRNFSKHEINSILENECKLFEKIIDEVKPEFLITGETALQPHHLFTELCKSRGVKVLMLNHANWKNFCYISETRHKIDNFDKIDSIDDPNANFTYLQNLWNKNKVSAYHKKYFEEIKNSKLSFLTTVINYFFTSNKNIKTHYTYFGRTKFKVLLIEMMDLIKKKKRTEFIESNFVTKLENDKPFLYLPLHQEPERSLLLAAPKFKDQIKTIKEVSKNLPQNYQLFVKEHPTQGPARGWRDISVYKEIINTPNVELFHPNFDSKILLENCDAVVSVGGTSSFEAAFFGKPSIIFADLGYSIIPSIIKLDSYDDLKDGIKNCLNTNVNPIHVFNYIKTLEKNSFIFEFMNFEIDYSNWFYNNANTTDVVITSSKMKKFLFNHKSELENLSNEYAKKINQLKN